MRTRISEEEDQLRCVAPAGNEMKTEVILIGTDEEA